MPLPEDLIFCRHGKSQANVLQELLKEGKLPAVPKEIQGTADWEFRLDELGIEQAAKAGEWLKKNLGERFFKVGYVSPYARAVETAGHLRLEVEWRMLDVLVERDWGRLTQMPLDVQRRMRQERKRNPAYWVPPDGRSIKEKALDMHGFFGTLSRQHESDRVIVTSHGETMWAARILLERFNPIRFSELFNSKDPLDEMNNCQILHYSRRNPDTGELSKRIEWMRSVCPWDLSRSRNEWVKIVRMTYTSTDLLEYAAKFKKLDLDGIVARENALPPAS